MKAIFFDFDGTLTIKGANIWKAIQDFCGYDTGKDSYYRELFSRFMSHEITHQEWCDLTRDKFEEAKFNKKDFENLAKEIKLIDGLKMTLKVLKENNYSLHIISGNIVLAINIALGDNAKYFDTINANQLFFDENGVLNNIKGTNYDFEGKARFIEEFKEKTNSNANDLIFIGNGNNDEWAHLSGCKTICINPDNTESSNKTKWHKCIDNVTNLNQILDAIGIGRDKKYQHFCCYFLSLLSSPFI